MGKSARCTAPPRLLGHLPRVDQLLYMKRPSKSVPAGTTGLYKRDFCTAAAAARQQAGIVLANMEMLFRLYECI